MCVGHLFLFPICCFAPLALSKIINALYSVGAVRVLCLQTIGCFLLPSCSEGNENCNYPCWPPA